MDLRSVLLAHFSQESPYNRFGYIEAGFTQANNDRPGAFETPSSFGTTHDPQGSDHSQVQCSCAAACLQIVDDQAISAIPLPMGDDLSFPGTQIPTLDFRRDSRVVDNVIRRIFSELLKDYRAISLDGDLIGNRLGNDHKIRQRIEKIKTSRLTQKDQRGCVDNPAFSRHGSRP